LEKIVVLFLQVQKGFSRLANAARLYSSQVQKENNMFGKSQKDQEKEKEETKTCPGCGREISKYDMECPYCGRKFIEYD